MPSALGKTILASISRNITALLFGERYSMDHPRRRFLAQAAFQIARNASFVSPTDFLPTLRKLLFCIPRTRLWNISKGMGKLLNFFRFVDIPARRSESSCKICMPTYETPEINLNFIRLNFVLDGERLIQGAVAYK